MEVGVCAEAYDQEMSVSRRHINSAFMTFVVLDQEGQPRTLPMVAPEPGVRMSRMSFSPALVARDPWESHSAPKGSGIRSQTNAVLR